MAHRLSRVSPTQRACWMLVLLMKASSGFSPQRPSSPAPSCSFRTCLDTPLNLMRDEDEGSSKKGPFHRAVNILRKKRGRDEEVGKSSMHMLTTDLQQTGGADESAKLLRGNFVPADFILKSFENTDPTDVFPPSTDAPTKRRDLTFSNAKDEINPPNIMPSEKKSSTNKTTKNIVRSNRKGGPLLNRMTRSWFENFLKTAIVRRSIIPPIDLKVRVAPRAVVARLCRGQFRCDASIDARRVVFRDIRMTGGTLEAKRMTVSFLQKPRYSNQFDIHAHNCTFTQDDLFESSSIRNGLAGLLVRILSNAGLTTSQIQVTAVDIVPSGKISCSGQADSVFGTKVPFEVRSGIDISSRGHVVRFPGLEVSLGPSLGVFMPVVPDIDLDIGHNARLHKVHVDGRRRRVTLSASATVTPTHTMKLGQYRQPKDSYSAQFSFDVGRWVTNLGNFTS